MKHLRKWISGLLILCMAISMLPVSVFAQSSVHPHSQLEGMKLVELPDLQTSAPSVSTFALDSNGNPTIKSTREVKWIDRLADLPSYATDFYNWLIENGDGDGKNDALIDPTTATLSGDYYVYKVTSLNNITLTYTYESGASDSDIAQAAVDAISAHGREQFDTVRPYLSAVYAAFNRDCPDVFWLSFASMASYEFFEYDYDLDPDGDGIGNASYSINVTFILQSSDFDVRAEEYRSVSSIQSAITTRDNAVETIISGASGTRQEIIKHLNEWLTTHNCYNTSSNLNNISRDCRNCIGALDGRTGTSGPVCESYARAFKVLCDELSIPCVLVDGDAVNSSGVPGAHMWNYVQMDDGAWYGVDVTWNDPSASGVSSAVSGYENENYLLVGSETVISGKTFISSHPVSNIVYSNGTAFTNGPELATEKYTPSNDHNWGDWTQTKTPTCKAEGEEKRTCSECGATETRSVATINHTYSSAVTAPTCTENGYTTYTCSVCGDSYTGNTVAATGHSWGSWTQTKAPTCKAEGEEKRTCSECGATVTRSVATTDHTYSSVVTAPTCTEDGYTTYTCSACGDSYTGNTVKATGHSWGSWTQTKAPTCKAEGEEKRTCSECGATDTRSVATVDHAYSSVVTAPTCTEDGYTTYTCSVCGDSYTGNTVAATGHSWDDGVVTKEATEEEAGIKTYTCETCGTTRKESIPPLNHTHSYTAVVTAPTCTEAGFTTYTCECGDSYTADETKALGHTEVTDAAVAATCTEAGLTEGKHCSVCDKVLTAQKEVPATGHSWDEGVVTKEATEKEPGIRTYTCESCGSTRTEEIPVLDPAAPSITRISGNNRFKTSLAAADELKEVLGVNAFETIILASGDNFADALTGSYLAAVKSAPILLHRDSVMEENLAYISENLAENGTVYILGGINSVSEAIENTLKDESINVIRLAGANRFETNLKILEEAGVSNEEILICTAYNFADSLSASAVGLPILLVGDELSNAQNAFLADMNGNTLTIIGGVNSVSEAIADHLEVFGTVSRVAGSTREKTSVAVAERFFNDPSYVVLAYSRNYPDGLCGGPLAYALGAPLILTASGAEEVAASYVQDNSIKKGIILGGTASITDATVQIVFELN